MAGSPEDSVRRRSLVIDANQRLAGTERGEIFNKNRSSILTFRAGERTKRFRG